jgi:flavin reductase (DIM6/NTAB) family NADH-FMN oxidoreductase RutF
MKREIPLQKSNRLINSGQVILVTSCYKDKTNIITLAWSSPLSHKPPLLGISVAKTHLSCELIHKTKEFAINIPSLELLDKVVYCGTHHGYDIDKFKEAKFTAVKANRLIKIPLIKECIGHLECILRDSKDIGDHILFIAEVVFASVEDSFFNEVWNLKKIRLIYHLGGTNFTASGELIKIK